MSFQERAEELQRENLELKKRVAELETSESMWRGMWDRLKESDKSFAAKNATLLKASEGMEKALDECREYFDQRSDCDHNGINFIANEENQMLGLVDKSLADFRAVRETMKKGA